MDVGHIDDAAINTSYKFKGGVEGFGANFRLDTNTVSFFWTRKPTNFEIMRCVEEAEKQGQEGLWCYGWIVLDEVSGTCQSPGQKL